MRFCVQHKALVLGMSQDPQLAMMLDAVPVFSELTSVGNGETKTAFCYPLDAFEDIGARCLALIQEAFEQLDVSIGNNPVLLITPQYGFQDEDTLTLWSQRLAQTQTELFGHPLSKIFPYGRSSLVMALSYARELLQSNPDQVVWFVSVDSLGDRAILGDMMAQGVLSNEQGDGVVGSEGAMILGLTSSDKGLAVCWSGSDAYLKTSDSDSLHHDQAVELLFRNVVEKVGQPLDQIYLPDNGQDRLTNAWLHQYQVLAPVLTKETELHFTSVFTGELGSVGALYRFLKIYESYQLGRIEGTTLQCEISDKLYRAAALYQWQY